MSGRDTSVSTQQIQISDKHHADFNSSTADFIVRSCDGVRFKCHKLFLQEASPVFRTMLSLPQPSGQASGTVTPDPTAKPPSIDLSEDSTVLEILLRLIYPMIQPVIESVKSLTAAFLASEKYEMAGVISSLRYVTYNFKIVL